MKIFGSWKCCIIYFILISLHFLKCNFILNKTLILTLLKRVISFWFFFFFLRMTLKIKYLDLEILPYLICLNNMRNIISLISHKIAILTYFRDNILFINQEIRNSSTYNNKIIIYEFFCVEKKI